MPIHSVTTTSGARMAISRALRSWIACKLGFTSALIPPRRGKGGKAPREGGIAVTEIAHLRDLVARFMEGTAAKGVQRREPARR